MKRVAMGLGLAVMVAMTGCGDDPQPMRGTVAWSDGCLPSMDGRNCTSASHAVTGAAGSPVVLVDCSVTPADGQTEVLFRIAAGNNFDTSNEGMFVFGRVNGQGQEMTSGFMIMRGNGWTNTQNNGRLGPANNCHVFVDRIVGKNITGRVACSGLIDDASPPRERFVRGNPPVTSTADFAEFNFENCQ